MQNKPGALDLEAGKAASVSFGRPNIKKIIAEEVAGLPSSEHVGVIVSGWHCRPFARSSAIALHYTHRGASRTQQSAHVPALACIDLRQAPKLEMTRMSGSAWAKDLAALIWLARQAMPVH